jgi:hypothetical protein
MKNRELTQQTKVNLTPLDHTDYPTLFESDAPGDAEAVV